MLISIKTLKNSAFLGSDKSRVLFSPLINDKMPTIVGILTFMSGEIFMLINDKMPSSPLINDKMPTIVGILTFMSRKIFMLRRVEHEKVL